MNRFAVFAGYSFYPSGGWQDFRDSFETEAEARAYVAGLKESGSLDWQHIVDLDKGEMLS